MRRIAVLALSPLLVVSCFLSPKNTCDGIFMWTQNHNWTMSAGDSIFVHAELVEAMDDDENNRCVADGTRVLLTSENPAIAIIRSGSYVVGVSKGQAKIVATNEKSGKAGYLIFTVR